MLSVRTGEVGRRWLTPQCGENLKLNASKAGIASHSFAASSEGKEFARS